MVQSLILGSFGVFLESFGSEGVEVNFLGLLLYLLLVNLLVFFDCLMELYSVVYEFNVWFGLCFLIQKFVKLDVLVNFFCQFMIVFMCYFYMLFQICRYSGEYFFSLNIKCILIGD